MDLIHDIKTLKDSGAADAELAGARNYQRQAQFYIDFLVSENSMGFHAPQYSMKSLAEAIDFCRKGQNSLRQLREVKSSSSSPGKPAGGK
jgi:nitrite reductase (cytochrome c-552)